MNRRIFRSPEQTAADLVQQRKYDDRDPEPVSLEEMEREAGLEFVGEDE